MPTELYSKNDDAARTENSPPVRLKITIRGAVQGVGFRPFVFRLASSLELKGWVSNFSGGVRIELEGKREKLQEFLLKVESQKPPRSFIQSLEASFLDATGYTDFEIRGSETCEEKTALVMPDIATCPDCLEEVFDPGNRRYLYPFTNCTNCGPRYSIIESLPYDRSRTTMKKFEMCERCHSEYDSPADRRFHAEPNACSNCGPHLELWSEDGEIIARHGEALEGALWAILGGHILALKGISGFHLLVDARNAKAVRRLRERKRHEEKPLALMFPSLESIKNECEVSDLEERLLLSPEAPIVILRRKRDGLGRASIAKEVAPNNPYIGAMLPYTPLHHIILRKLGASVVATSGNLSDEVLCSDEHEAVERLRGIADLFLVYNRPIVRHADDSILRVVSGRELMLRRARGFAPLPITLKNASASILAVGAHMKNAISISQERNVFLSPHVGDLETTETIDTFKRVIQHFKTLYDVKPNVVACDRHPDYFSTRFAEELSTPIVHVQHHYAHVLACMADNEIEDPVLGVVWDGTGYGLDGTAWGGEFLRTGEQSFKRVAHFRVFPLLGGDAAVRDTRRLAIGLLYEIFGDPLFTMEHIIPLENTTADEIRLFQAMLQKHLNTPTTSSAGRIFDAVSALLGICLHAGFEGQAAMLLEYALTDIQTEQAYPFQMKQENPDVWIIDWEDPVRGIMSDQVDKTPVGVISAKFHNTLAEMITVVAERIGEERVVLTGGCFQNKYLTERTIKRLRKSGFRPYWHQRIPPNDGGIAVGQTLAATSAKFAGTRVCA